MNLLSVFSSISWEGVDKMEKVNKLMRHKLYIILFGLLFISCSQPKIDDKYVQLNFENSSVNEFIDYVSEVTKNKIELNEEIEGKINFVTSQLVLKSDLLTLVNSILETHQRVLIKTGKNHYKVLKSSNKNLTICSWNVGDDREHGEMKTLVFNLEDLNATVIRIKVKALLSKNSKMIFMKKKNLLAVTDYEHVLRSVKSLISTIKANSDKRVE